MPNKAKNRRLVALLVAGAATLPSAAAAQENGASVYLLGSGGPEAAVLPPLPGVYLDNTIYIYGGETGGRRDLVLGGNLTADVDATIIADFASLVWVPTTDLGGLTLAVGGALPLGAPIVDADVAITGPLGNTIDVRRHDSALVVGDPIVTAMLGWNSGKFHVSASGLINIPVGNYREGQLANVAFHRWAGDLSVALTWHDDDSGWDISGKTGVTVNGRNDVTDFNSGNDFHIEGSVEKTFEKKYSLGVLGYYFHQISDNTGSGARAGPSRGRVTGLGGTAAFHTVLGRSPATFRVKLLQEFNAEYRPKGTALMLDLSLPLSMKMPAGAAP